MKTKSEIIFEHKVLSNKVKKKYINSTELNQFLKGTKTKTCLSK